MKTVSSEQILAMMEEGKGYSRKSFHVAFPSVEPIIINDALAKLVERGQIWNGNLVTYVRFAPRAASNGTLTICPAHEWGNLKGYEAGLARHRSLAELTRRAA